MLVFLAKNSIIEIMKDFSYSPIHNGDIKPKQNVVLLNRLITIFLCLCIAFGIFVVGVTSTYYSAEVEGQSMKPTINYLTTENEVAYYTTYKEAQKGDIIIVDYADSTSLNIEAIKRLIAVGGDTVCYYNNNIYVNGKAISEPYMLEAYNKIKQAEGKEKADEWKNTGYARSKQKFENFCEQVLEGNAPYNTTFGNNYATDYANSIKYSESLQTYVLTVPQDFVFFLGDNRGGSVDCSSIGPIEAKYVLVKVDFIAPANQSILTALWVQFLKTFK